MNTPCGTILKFRYYSLPQLLQVKEQLALSLSQDELLLCAEHYRTVEKKDPTTDELRFLDTVFQKAKRLPLARTLKQLQTNDAFVAQTYSDALQKLRALSGDVLPPCTPLDLFTAATRYLAYAGKSPSLPHHSVSLEERRAVRRLPSTVCGCGISDAPYQLRVLPQKAPSRKPEPGDALVLLMPCEGKSISDYQKRIGILLNRYEQNVPWKSFDSISESGLLFSLLSQSSVGFWIDTHRLVDKSNAAPFFCLTESFDGCHFAIASHASTTELIEAATELGIRAIVPGSVTREAKITLVRGSIELLSVSTSFLRKCIGVDSVIAKLPGEADRILQKIAHTPTTPASCAYLQNSDTTFPTDVAIFGGAVCASTFSKPNNSFFRHALFAALCPILLLSASGYQYSEQRLAIGITTPDCTSDGERAYGELLSSILGIYRVQAELGIPAAAASMHTSQTVSHPQTTVFAVAEGNAASNSFTKAENPVYCFAPQLDPDGLPDFAPLRALLQELTRLAQSGIICSARAICNEAVTDGLLKMSRNGLYCRIDGRIAAADALPLAIIVECTQSLEGQSPIGWTAQKEIAAESSANSLSTPTPKSQLIWSDRTEFVLLCKPDDLDAQVLADVITQKGGRASLFENTHTDEGALARAILGAHVLILCGDVRLPKTPQMQFATDTFLRANGACWSVGQIGSAPLNAPVTRFDSVIPMEYIDKMIK